MKAIRILLFLILIPFVSNSQITRIWTDTIEETPQARTECAVLDKFSNYYLGFDSIFLHAPHFVIKLDSSGNVLWSKKVLPDSIIPDTLTNSQLFFAGNPNPNLLLIVSSSYLSVVKKLDVNGSMMWEKIFPYNLFEAFSATNGLIYTWGLTTAPNTEKVITVLDSSGNILRSDTSDNQGGYGYHCFSEDEHQNIYFNYSVNLADGCRYKYINEYLVDSTHYPVSGNFYLDRFSNQYYLANDFTLTKYDSLGNSLWSANTVDATELAIDTLGNVYTVKMYDYNIQSLIRKFDSSGNLLWASPLTASSSALFYYREMNIDMHNNLIMSGNKFDGPGSMSTSSHKNFIAIVNSQGHLSDYFESQYPNSLYSIVRYPQISASDIYFYCDELDLSTYMQCIDLHGHPNIIGNFYLDQNSDCVQNSTENNLPGIFVSLNPGNHFTTTQLDGKFSFEVPDGNYTLDYSIPANWQTTCPTAPVSVNVVNGVSNAPTVFGLTTIQGINDLEIDFSHINPVANHDVTILIHYKNWGSTTLSGSVDFVFDPIFTFVSTNVSTDTISGTTVAWSFSNLQPLEERYIILVLHCGLYPSATPYTNTANIYTLSGDANIWNNSQTETRVTSGAVDPNDKYVVPSGDGPTGSISYTDSILCYKIAFQNTGNDTAFYIQVIDTLDESLDPLSIQIATIYPAGGSYSLSDNGVLNFKFDPAALPDSTTDLLNSQGFITYYAKLKPNLPLGTTIRNHADIYFDYNQGVRTSTTVNTLNHLVSVNDVRVLSEQFAVFPNPSADVAYVKSENPSTEFSIVVLNFMGEIVHSKSYATSIGVIDTKDLQAGMYFIKIESEGRMYLKKIIVEHRW